VPSGNFGNLCAGLLARRLGLPLGALALATNANTTVPEYLAGGEYRPRPTVATLSNAMDVGAPSNWERIAWLAGGDIARLRAELRWGSVDDAGTRTEIARLAAVGYAVDPHGAVASAVLRKLLAPGESGLFLATAHPAKFDVTAENVPLPPSLAAAMARPLLAEPLAADGAALRTVLRAA
jgi:threonine synthase